ASSPYLQSFPTRRSSDLNDSLIIGMGNTMIDFSMGQQLNPGALKMMGALLKNNAPAKYEASKHFLQVAATIAPHLSTRVRGVNRSEEHTSELQSRENIVC